MLYSEKDIKITFRQMMVYLCVAVVVAAAGIVAGLLLGFSDHLSTGTIVAILCIAGAVFLFGNFFAPCYSYYKYLNEVLSGRSHLREGIVREISKKPIYKDNKNYYYEVLVEMDDDLYAQFLYDSNLGKPPLEVGKPVQMKCYENFIIEILEQAK